MCSNRRPSSERLQLDLRAKLTNFGRNPRLMLCPCLGVGQHSFVQLDVAPHCILENRDRARQRTNFVTAIAIWHDEYGITASHRLGDTRNIGKRQRDQSINHERAEYRQYQHRGTEYQSSPAHWS